MYLTFLGGGVFGNKKEWIADAIAKAIVTAQRHGSGISIKICHFRKIDEEMKDLIKDALSRCASHDDPA